MITGAGGSIGSELSRQVLRFEPAKVLLFDHDENALFHIERELRVDHPGMVVPLIGDITDRARVDQVMAEHRPNVVLHAAAHKHVPMMESNPGEAIKNNVVGTQVVATLADTYGVTAFVMISTDKAVNPSSVMGASKRMAEMVVQALSQRSTTRYVTVRFGNVLGSAGSVVPIFRDQIAKGGPVTVTHPDMRRYFMTIPEACQLVVQAGVMGRGGEIFVLDMGEPVKIVDLARDLIRLSGLEPDRDIEIKVTGVRPGEKLFEELAVDDEHVDKTKHPKIYVGRLRPYALPDVEQALTDLHRVSDAGDAQALKRVLKKLVPEYSAIEGETGDKPGEAQRETPDRKTPDISALN